jgi:hypothetical protein
MKICKECVSSGRLPERQERHLKPVHPAINCASRPARRAEEYKLTKSLQNQRRKKIKLRRKHLKLASNNKHKIKLNKRQLELLNINTEETKKHGWAGKLIGNYLEKQTIVSLIMLKTTIQKKSPLQKIKELQRVNSILGI